MAMTWGSKVNGILTVFTIGIAVLVDLWEILDIKKGHTMVRYTVTTTNSRLTHAHRITFGGISPRELSDSLVFRLFSTSPSSTFTLPCL